ncbi:acyl-CoA synthetase family protein [Pseudomonas sp. RIT-PI-AD]|uniref:acyl-CoA synthetase family protein n=1 Tax=Pseudomonas sp. RIT-PI-AD TaxID=3035294 RepID=UPI0021DA7908|nr:acyl-CoA synthetase family protein [Pseudomonas sp. RIT-PI-AD]
MNATARPRPHWIDLERQLLAPHPGRPVALYPDLDHAALVRRALGVAAALRARRVATIALYLEDAAELACALLGAWRAGIGVLLPADAQAQTRKALAERDIPWLDSLDGLEAEPLAAAALDPDACRLTLCTSGSSGEAKAIDKSLRQLTTEAAALERLWGADLGNATVLGSVAAQHIYGLLFRVLWPLCAGRPFLRRAQPFPEDLQRESLALAERDAGFAWVASPALLKRMGENLDWPALRPLRRLFSSGGALPDEAAAQLHRRLGQWPTEIYGSSETGGIGWRQGDERWQPFAGVELGVDPDGALHLTSPYLPPGHREQTADAVRIDADGRFLLRGRLDRIVKLEEKRIALPMLEQALAGHPWVADARLGVVQEGRAFLGVLLAPSAAGLHVLRNRGRRALTEGLRRHLAGYCDALAVPRRWRLLERLPYNSQGKLPQAQVDAQLAAPRPTRCEPDEALEVDGEWQLRLRVPLDLAHFSGHFPHTPVLPGVVQVDWAQHLARARMALPPRFRGLEVLKFQQLIRPGDALRLSLRFDAERGKLYFAYRQGDTACSSGRILLGEPGHA